ncbi:peptide chain release factor N(5)-glutamine methyltransferase [bacterium]|nr:peptide chain release factor N(5)-glutamine methyltransferase [bacterium]
MYRKIFIDKYLKNGFSFDEAKVEVDFALEVLFNYTYKDFMLGKSIEKWQLAKLEKVLNERISTHRPIQQIIGQAFFYGRKFFVDENTLIPRPETELLVQETLKLATKFEKPKILDIGTGTGCIPITLVVENKNIFAESVDISFETIETAKKNVLLHNVFEKVRLYQSDLFENVDGTYNIIVSNPPYIPIKDKETLQVEVRDYDPASALYTSDEYGVEFYIKIIEQAKKYLLPDGYLLFELGINQHIIVEKCLKDNGFSDINVVQDYNSIERIIIAKA